MINIKRAVTLSEIKQGTVENNYISKQPAIFPVESSCSLSSMRICSSSTSFSRSLILSQSCQKSELNEINWHGLTIQNCEITDCWRLANARGQRFEINITYFGLIQSLNQGVSPACMIIDKTAYSMHLISLN